MSAGNKTWVLSGLLSRSEDLAFSHRRLVRWLLCGPVAFVATLFVMAGMASWWPEGAAQVNNVVMPIILFPLIWAGFFFYGLLDENLPRVSLAMNALILGHVAFLLMR